MCQLSDGFVELSQEGATWFAAHALFNQPFCPKHFQIYLHQIHSSNIPLVQIVESNVHQAHKLGESGGKTVSLFEAVQHFQVVTS